MRASRLTIPLIAAGATYWRYIRGPVLTWGATEEEAASRLPGDGLLEDADGVVTRAIEINAPASAVWPWLVQMGPAPRGGAYTYDWIENLLGLNMHTVDRVLPEFQHPQLGETIGYGTNRMRLELIEPERAFAWRSEDGSWVWSFILREQDGVTRLISRNRFRLTTPVTRVGMLFMEPASLVMERKMLLGIKQRAERLAASSGQNDSPRAAGLTSRPTGTRQSSAAPVSAPAPAIDSECRPESAPQPRSPSDEGSGRSNTHHRLRRGKLPRASGRAHSSSRAVTPAQQNASPAVKTSNPRLSPRGADAPSVAFRLGVRIPAAGPAHLRLYSHSGGLGRGELKGCSNLLLL